MEQNEKDTKEHSGSTADTGTAFSFAFFSHISAPCTELAG